MDPSSLQFINLAKADIKLVNHFYKQTYKKGMAKKNDQIFVLKGQEILCAARIKNVAGAQLLTGVTCAEHVRQQGLASYLIKQVLKQQTEILYCFPYPHLANFYQTLGFLLITPEQLPEELALAYTKYNQRKPLLIMAYQKA